MNRIDRIEILHPVNPVHPVSHGLSTSIVTARAPGAQPMCGRSCLMDIVLETERLVLRRLTMADLDDLVELNSDPAVTYYINGGKPIPRDVIQNEHLPRTLAYYERRNG